MKTTRRLTIDEILQRFFSEQRADTKGITLLRIRRIEERLRECVEAEAESILVTSDLKIVAAEREFEPEGAVARTMHADDLIFVLSEFVKDPWLPAERLQRAKQVQLSTALTGYLLRSGLVDPAGMSCALIEIEVAVHQERARQRRARREGQPEPRGEDMRGGSPS